MVILLSSSRRMQVSRRVQRHGLWDSLWKIEVKNVPFSNEKWWQFFGRWDSVWEISKKSLMKINCENWTIMLASTLPNVQIWDRLRLPVLLLLDQLTRVRSSDREVPVQSGRQWGCLCPLLLVRMLVILVIAMMIVFWGIVQPGLARSELFFAMFKAKLGPKMPRNLWLRIWHVSPRQR